MPASHQSLSEATAVAAFRSFLRQAGATGISFGHPSPVSTVGDVAGLAFLVFGAGAAQLPRDGAVVCPCGTPVRIHVDSLAGGFVARLFPCNAAGVDAAGQTTFI